jgi:hypothetical protein
MGAWAMAMALLSSGAGARLSPVPAGFDYRPPTRGGRDKGRGKGKRKGSRGGNRSHSSSWVGYGAQAALRNRMGGNHRRRRMAAQGFVWNDAERRYEVGVDELTLVLCPAHVQLAAKTNG